MIYFGKLLSILIVKKIGYFRIFQIYHKRYNLKYNKLSKLKFHHLQG